MNQATVYQKYKLSVVSGGKPLLSRVANRSCCDKGSGYLTRDELSYIVPFNNQIKVYSTETRQCVKTLKFGNNECLSEIFIQNKAIIADIILGDATRDEVEREEDKQMTVFTDTGRILILNYRGKLLDSPRTLQLELEKDETVCKVFSAEGGSYKLLTSQESFGNGSEFTYKIYDIKWDEKVQLSLETTFENVILSTWSSRDKYLAFLCHNENKKNIKVYSVFDSTTMKDFPLNLASQQSSSSSANSKYVTSMAIDCNGTQLALGFASGVINVIEISNLQERLLKWHIDAVLSLCFTQDGSYLLSGGWEKVLSFWQLSTNMQQFLPRLNGVIISLESVANDKYYSVALQMTENTSNSDYQLLLLNAADLTSKVVINGPLPVFVSAVRDTVQPVSAIATKASTTLTTSSSSKKKHRKKLLKAKRQDFTTCASINPVTKQIYLPHMSAMQSYDFYRNEQTSYQYMASGVNNSMGKVKFEMNIQDPLIADVQFTKDGKWMATYEIEYPPEDLLSSKDLVHILKFWDKEENRSDWNLRTKVINPHGTGVPITKILPAPWAVNGSQGFLTADNDAGLKYWSYEEYEKNWCLKKISLPNLNHFSNSVSLAWSQDGSLIFHAFDEKIFVIDFETFRQFETSNEKINEFNMDSEIQAIKLVNNTNLIVATRTTLNTINLLNGVITKSYDLYPYVDGVYKNGHLDRLISCDEKTGTIALVINQKLKDIEGNPSINYKSRVIVFDNELSKKLGSFTHTDYISWIGWNHHTDFIFLDSQCRLGIIGTTVNTEMSDESNKDNILDGLKTGKNDFTTQLAKLSSSKRIDGPENDDQDEEIALEFINGDKNDKLINMNSFTSMLDNFQNIQMDTLFDRVMRIIG
ncbi:hypothetical protein HG537_0F02440 [Torulaspora globosa]|uniref:Uncharacterized protein n=1 Tax=Torulaspora globosa TaxID=48254 RepID=A0A7H9HW09_9SACH|nr:hypothetical protein HG537_0F02440 [Torulaspora sp. CBS 2947]